MYMAAAPMQSFNTLLSGAIGRQQVERHALGLPGSTTADATVTQRCASQYVSHRTHLAYQVGWLCLPLDKLP